jgi:hypothetical protein
LNTRTGPPWAVVARRGGVRRFFRIRIGTAMRLPFSP